MDKLSVGGGFGGGGGSYLLGRIPHSFQAPDDGGEGGAVGGTGGGDGMSVGGDALNIDADAVSGGGDQLEANQNRGEETGDGSQLHISARTGAMSDEGDQQLDPAADEQGQDPNAQQGQDPAGQPPKMSELQQAAAIFSQQAQSMKAEFQAQLQGVQQQNSQVIQSLQQQNQALVKELSGFLGMGRQRAMEEQRQARLPQRPPPDAPEQDHFRYELAMERVRSNEALQAVNGKLQSMEQAIRQDAEQRAQQFEQQKMDNAQAAWDAQYDAAKTKVRGIQNYKPWLGTSEFTAPDGTKAHRGEVFADIIYDAYCKQFGKVVDPVLVHNEINQWVRDAAKVLSGQTQGPQQRQQQNTQQRQQQGQRKTAAVVPMGGAPRRSPQQGGGGQKTPNAALRQKFFANPHGLNGNDGARILPS